MFNKTIALAMFTMASFGFGVLLFAQPQDVVSPSVPSAQATERATAPQPPPKLPLPPYEPEPLRPPLPPPLDDAGVGRPTPPDVGERQTRKERLAAGRKSLSEFQGSLQLPEEWRRVRDSLDSIIAAIRSDERWPRKAAVQFAQATVVALLADEEDKEALESKERLLSLLQRGLETPRAYHPADRADLHEWLQVRANLNRIIVAHRECESAEALYQGGRTTLHFVLNAQQRLAEGKLEFARTSFTQFPLVDDDVIGIVARDETLAFIEVKTYREAKYAAMETWMIVYEKWLGEVSPIQDEAHARQNLYMAEAQLQAALASLRRKQKARAEAEVDHGLPKSGMAKRPLSGDSDVGYRSAGAWPSPNPRTSSASTLVDPQEIEAVREPTASETLTTARGLLYTPRAGGDTYEKVDNMLDELIDDYPNTDHARKAEKLRAEVERLLDELQADWYMRVAKSHLRKSGQKQQAVDELQKIIQDYPSTQVAAEARKILEAQPRGPRDSTNLSLR